MPASPLSLRKYLRHLKDPRIERNKRHLLIDIISIAICAVVGNADTWSDVATFARRRKQWFQRFLQLPSGIPSHHTFRRVFDRLDPVALQKGLIEWLHGLTELLGARHIAIDGKTLRHSGGGSSPLRQLHLVSAWATEANLVLGEIATEEKSNEITAIPKLLEMLDLHGAFVTIDAMGCQKDIAQKIVERGGDYVLTVKDNHAQLKEDILACFERAYAQNCRGLQYDWHQAEGTGHGRQEKRLYEVIVEPQGIRNRASWAKLTVIGKCYTERTVNGQTSVEERCFIGSKRCSAKRYGELLRNHWSIENHLHWQMDVTFGEDASRIQNRHGGENFALLRRLALGLLKRHPGKGSMRSKRYEAALDIHFLEEILSKPVTSEKLK
jgi:predicted transposase YbfD/YdcC